ALLRVARGIGDMARADANDAGAPNASTTAGAPGTMGIPDAASPAHLRPVARWLWIACATVLGVTGMAQMPIAARYGIAAVPGLAWTADFHFTHLLHYGAAAVLLALSAWLAVRALAGPRIPRLFAPHRHPTPYRHPAPYHLTGGGTLRLWLVAALIVTGGMRVAKNLPGFDWGPTLTMYLDWTHLGLAGLLGMASLALALTGRSAWTAPVPASRSAARPAPPDHHHPEHPPRA
ncbi:(4Fe-4S)-binding protein, partial [Desulfovibrio sp. DS-1]